MADPLPAPRAVASILLLHWHLTFASTYVRRPELLTSKILCFFLLLFLGAATIVGGLSAVSLLEVEDSWACWGMGLAALVARCKAFTNLSENWMHLLCNLAEPKLSFFWQFPTENAAKTVVVKWQGSSVSLNMIFLNNCLKQADYTQDASWREAEFMFRKFCDKINNFFLLTGAYNIFELYC